MDVSPWSFELFSKYTVTCKPPESTARGNGLICHVSYVVKQLQKGRKTTNFGKGVETNSNDSTLVIKSVADQNDVDNS